MSFYERIMEEGASREREETEKERELRLKAEEDLKKQKSLVAQLKEKLRQLGGDPSLA